MGGSGVPYPNGCRKTEVRRARPAAISVHQHIFWGDTMTIGSKGDSEFSIHRCDQLKAWGQRAESVRSAV